MRCEVGPALCLVFWVVAVRWSHLRGMIGGLSGMRPGYGVERRVAQLHGGYVQPVSWVRRPCLCGNARRNVDWNWRGALSAVDAWRGVVSCPFAVGAGPAKSSATDGSGVQAPE